jgi:hypothetical protein
MSDVPTAPTGRPDTREAGRALAGSSGGVEAAVAAARGDRDALEALKAQFQGRIARRSSDFEATRGLKLVEAELSGMASPAPDPWDKAVRKLLPR